MDDRDEEATRLDNPLTFSVAQREWIDRLITTKLEAAANPTPNAPSEVPADPSGATSAGPTAATPTATNPGNVTGK